MENANNNNDLFWYVMIALGVVVLCILAAIYFPSKWTHNYDNWVEFALLTGALFGYLIKWYWHCRKIARFWVTYTILLLAHCIVFIPVFSHLGRLSVIVFGALGALEAMALGLVVYLMLGKDGVPRV